MSYEQLFKLRVLCLNYEGFPEMVVGGVGSRSNRKCSPKLQVSFGSDCLFFPTACPIRLFVQPLTGLLESFTITIVFTITKITLR